MRKLMVISIFLILAVALVACGGNDGGTTNDNTGSTVGEGTATPIPSPTATPWPTLPPTNVPQSFQHQGHIYTSGVSTVHTVQAGETLAQIANRYEVPLDLIANANRIYDMDSIDEGEILYIPPCE